MGIYEDLRQYHIELRREEPMAAHTSFRIGGPAELFLLPKDLDSLTECVSLLRHYEIPFRVIGKGSNLLVNDEGIRGAVVSTEQLTGHTLQDTVLSAFAGESLTVLARTAADHCLSGLEFAYGIPGSLGGAVVMNAGAYGGEMSDVIDHVKVLTPQGECLELSGEQLELGYRTSCIEKNGYIVLGASLRLTPGDREAVWEVMNRNMAARKEKQPLEYPSAGSTFKRPEGYFAGKLIMDAGLRGFRIGGAQISEKHCGFVINRDHATAADVRELIRQTRQKVYESFGVKLECEVKFI